MACVAGTIRQGISRSCKSSMRSVGAPYRTAARNWLAVLALAASTAGFAAEDVDAALRHADDIKTSNHAEFQEIVRRLDAERDALSPAQRINPRNLDAYELAFSGPF